MVEGSVTGSKPVIVRVRAWLNGRAKPGWQRTVRDSNAHRVTGSGKVRLVVRLTATAGRKKVTVPYRGVRVVRATATRTTAGRKPSAATTGVPAGTKLRVHKGTIVVTKAGTKLDRLDIHGFVVVKAANVTISRSIVRGGNPPKTAQGVITSYGPKNLLITDTEIRTAHPSVYLDGIKGWNFTARRVHVRGNVDSIKIQGDNVTVAGSLLENTTWYAHDPYQGGGATHNDNIQILKGRNLTISGNTIRGAQNFAVLGAANSGDVPNLVVRGNWLDGGHCTLKLQELKGHALKATVTDNRFGPHRAVSYCPIQGASGRELDRPEQRQRADRQAGADLAQALVWWVRARRSPTPGLVGSCPQQARTHQELARDEVVEPEDPRGVGRRARDVRVQADRARRLESRSRVRRTDLPGRRLGGRREPDLAADGGR